MADQSANIQSITAIDDFRAGYVQLIDVLGAALSAAESDMGRKANWLERDRIQYWKLQIRNRQEKLNQAKNVLRTKQLKPNDDDTPMPSFVDEKKAIQAAQRHLEEAEEKLRLTKEWIRKMERETQNFQSAIQRLQERVTTDTPRLLMKLDKSREALLQYIQTEAPDSSAIDAALREAGQVANASRGVTRSTKDIKNELHFAKLRSLTREDDRAAAPILEPGGFDLPSIAEKCFENLQSVELETSEVNPYQSLIIHHGFPNKNWILTRVKPVIQTDSGWTLTPDPETLDEDQTPAAESHSEVTNTTETQASSSTDSLDDLFDDDPTQTTTETAQPNTESGSQVWPVYRFHLEHWLDQDERMAAVFALPVNTILEFNDNWLVRVVYNECEVWKAEK